MRRPELIAELAGALIARRPDHPLRVGIDGVCGAGKTTFASELAVEIASRGTPATRIDSDGFHHVRERRYRQGRDSARGYYEDAYDFGALADLVLLPLGPGGDLVYATAVHDLATDAVISDAFARAPADAVMVFDATFIQGGVLEGLWDEVVFLDVDETVAAARGVARDAAALGGEDAARRAYNARYMAACRLYLEERKPREGASIVIDNTDPAEPVWVSR